MTDKLTGAARADAIRELEACGWALGEGRDAVSKRFEFRNFNEAFGWMTRAALHAEKLDHHPEWFNVYNRVEVTLSSHDVDGLSARDLTLARRLEKL